MEEDTFFYQMSWNLNSCSILIKGETCDMGFGETVFFPIFAQNMQCTFRLVLRKYLNIYSHETNRPIYSKLDWNSYCVVSFQNRIQHPNLHPWAFVAKNINTCIFKWTVS